MYSNLLLVMGYAVHAVHACPLVLELCVDDVHAAHACPLVLVLLVITPYYLLVLRNVPIVVP